MKKLKELNLNVIENESALTVKGGECGTVTDYYFQCGITQKSYMDWNDEECC